MNFLAAALYAVAASVILAIAAGFHGNGLNPNSAALALAGGSAIGIFGWVFRRQSPRLPPLTGWSIAALVCFGLFACRAFLWLIFREGDEVRVLSPNNLGDMSLHLTFIHYLANGAAFWPDSPIFSAGKLTYSVGADLFNALLALVGVDVLRGLIWTGLLGAFATVVALVRWGGAFTLMGFLCNGGFAAFAIFFSAKDVAIFQDWQAPWAWKNFALSILVTQRGFLFALPAGLLLLTSWRTRFLQDGAGWRMPFAGELLLYAALPAFHLHSFLALSFILGALLITREVERKRIIALIAAAFFPATALCYLTLGMFKSNAAPPVGHSPENVTAPLVDVLGWQPGWMVNDAHTAELWEDIARTIEVASALPAHGKFFVFWFGNFGIIPLLLVPAMVALLRPVLPRGPSMGQAWAVFIGVLVITPLLGLWNGYQQSSISTLLAGGDGSLEWRSAVIPTLAAVLLAAAVHFRRLTPERPLLVRSLFAIAGILFLDFVFAIFRSLDSRFPLLPANAVPLILATAGFIVFLTRARGAHAPWSSFMAVPALFLFFVCCNIRFANWDWDNTKLMLWAWLIFFPALWEILLSRWRPAVQACVCIVLFFSGFVSLLGGIGRAHRGYPITKVSLTDGVAHGVRGIPISETFACEPTYNHPLLLAGRKVVMGYDGHLGSHGIDYLAIEADLHALMLGAPDWRERAARLDVRYLFFGAGERAKWPDSLEPWQQSATVVASGEWGEIFDLRSASAVITPDRPTPRLAPPRLRLPSVPR